MAKKTTSAKKEIDGSVNAEYENRVLNEMKKSNILDDMKEWEKKSGITYQEWFNRFKKYILKVASNIEKTKPGWFTNASEEDIVCLLNQCKRNMYQNEYIPIVKPKGESAKTSEYFVFAMTKSDYFNWGKRNYNEAIAKYVNATDSTKKYMVETKEIVFETDKQGKITNTIPMMHWGKDKEGKVKMKAVPKNSYVCTVYGAAMPVSSYEKAISDKGSPEWNNLKPCMIDLSSNADKSIHYGDPEGDSYINMEAMKVYRGKFVEKRGKANKTKDGKTWYEYEGQVTESEEVDENGQKTKTKIYDGPKSFMHFLAPSGKKHEIKEVNIEQDFNFGEEMKENEVIEYLLNDVIYDTYKTCLELGDKKLHGLATLPSWFESYYTERKDRQYGSTPVAFECDILENYKTQVDEDDEDQFINRSFRVDDMLDSKLSTMSDFAEMRLSGIHLPDDLLAKFDSTAERSRIKAVITVSRKIDGSEKGNIEGDLLWFDIVKNSGGFSQDITDDVFNMEDTDENIEENDEIDFEGE